MFLKKLIKKIIGLAIFLVVAFFLLDIVLDVLLEEDTDTGTETYSTSENYDVYTDYDDYDDDSWSVLDYLFAYVGDDYGNDYEYEYDSSSGSYTYSGDDDSDDEPVVTTASSGNVEPVANSAPVSVSNQRKSFIEYALTLKGTPYVFGGKTPSTGLDCSGFVAFAARKAISVNFTGSAQTMYNAAKDVSMSSAEPGDLLFFSDNGSRISHVGIYLGKNSGQGSANQRMFVHSASAGSPTGVIVSTIDQSNYWSKHLVGAGSFLSSSSDVRTYTRSGSKRRSTKSSKSDFKKDDYWNDVDASWFED